MSKQILFIIGLFFSMQSFAQTGIGTTTPNASAKLDVYSTNKGFLPPRVILTSATDVTTIVSPAEGLLVYNLGSTGLQAGYYYWNATSWATIATATSAGNGVTSMDMVKLYGKAYSAATADSTIANASGYKFLVPASGRYLFDFSSTGYGNAYFTFKVRQGNTVLAVDSQYSYNNSVHVEYNGKVELNLQAGNTYNVYVFSSGSRDGGDFDRVYYKLVAGNLPVTGQSVDYAMANLSTTQSLSSAGNIVFNTIAGTGITLSSGGFNLVANKTYKLEAALGGSSGGYAYYAWVDNTNTILPGGSIGAISKSGGTATDGMQDKAVVYYTPTSNTTVYLRVITVSGAVTAYSPSSAVASNYSSTWASIQQIGSSAIVNPWTLSGTNTFNTSGNVGIGTSSPDATAILDLASTTKGILIPRMTASQKSAISSPTTGLLIFQTDAPSDFYQYNGSTWVSLREPNWTSAGTIQSVGWYATTTNPTIGTTTVNDYSYKQIGSKTWRCQLTFSAGSSSTGANNGSGDYLFTLPNSLQFNTSIAGQASYSADVGRSIWDWPGLWLSSSSGSITNLVQGGLLFVVPYSSTQFRLIHVGIAGVGSVIPYASGYYGVGSNISWRVTFTFQSL